MMIQLQNRDGSPILVNSANVLYVTPADDNATLIAFINGETLEVLDGYDAVAELFDPERQVAEPC